MTAEHTAESQLSECVRCGLCLQHCPTYVETGLETESPRGRLYLMQALSEGQITATTRVIGHLDMCLQCRNCEAVCPSGVPYGRLMEDARARVLDTHRAPLSWRLRTLVLREVVARPERLSAAIGALRMSQSAGIREVAEQLPFLGPRIGLTPWVRGRPFSGRGVVARPAGEAVMRVAMLTGCIMPFAFGNVHRATVRALVANGCVVVSPHGQACCGALLAHNGDLVAARELARRNVDAFLAVQPDAIVVNSAGCGAAMKEYETLLADDPEYASKAVAVAGIVRDVSEFLVELPLRAPVRPLNLSVTYQDSCHLSHAQRITDAPRQVLRTISGLKVVEMRRPDRCCGSAGVYGWTQAEMSLALLDAKVEDIESTGADVVATSNPGCIAQIDGGLRRRRTGIRVTHVVELLAKSYASI